MNSHSEEYIATVKQWKKTDLDQIIDYMVAEGTGLTRPQALAYFEMLVQSVEHFIKINGGVSTPLCHIRTTISGVFLNREDKFDNKRHCVHLCMSPGSRLKNVISQIKFKKENTGGHIPDPQSFIDAASETKNQMATPQSIATLKGDNLKFDSSDLEQGIFFVPENNVKGNIRVNFYSTVRTTEINFLVPLLPPGNYTVVIRTVMRRHRSIRAGVLHHLITVS
jgi:hypothetical protein